MASEISFVRDSLDDPHLTQLWVEAYEANPDLEIFQSLDWARLWTTHYKDADSVVVLLERVAGDAYFILPMMEINGILRSLTDNASDVTGTIYPPLIGNDVVPAGIAHYLSGLAKHRPVILWNVRTSDPLVRLLQASGHLEELDIETVHLVDLDDIRPNPQRWMRASATRQQAARDQRRLLARNVRIEHDIRPTESFFEAMVREHTRSWQSRGQVGKFADPRRVSFLHEILFAHSIRYTLSAITLADELVAYYLGFPGKRRFSAWNSAFNVDYHSLGPGTALLTNQVLYVAQTGSQKYYDFLRGDEPYKRRFSSDQEHVYTFRVVA